MNPSKYKYFDKLYMEETRLPPYYWWDDDCYNTFLENNEYYYESSSYYYYYDWLNDITRLRNEKIEEILSENFGNLKHRIPKSLFK